MYKDKKYRERSLKEIMEDIVMAKDHYGDLEKVFLCDGDAIALETDMLLAILKKLYQTFPSLRHVGSYVGPQSTLSKSMEELKELRAAGLTKAILVRTGWGAQEEIALGKLAAREVTICQEAWAVRPPECRAYTWSKIFCTCWLAV